MDAIQNKKPVQELIHRAAHEDSDAAVRAAAIGALGSQDLELFSEAIKSNIPTLQLAALNRLKNLTGGRWAWVKSDQFYSLGIERIFDLSKQITLLTKNSDSQIKKLASETLENMRLILKKEDALKLKEIVQKYSLTDEQSSILETRIVEKHINNLKEDLDISDVFASQLQNEVENRIMKKSTVVDKPEVKNTQPTLPEKNEMAVIKAPSYVPENLPGEEITDVEEKPIIGDQFVPKAENSKPAIDTVQQNISGQEKITQIKNEKEPEKSAPTEKPKSQYTVDPYREPIE
jgi:hypothetical protein